MVFGGLSLATPRLLAFFKDAFSSNIILDCAVKFHILRYITMTALNPHLRWYASRVMMICPAQPGLVINVKILEVL